MPPPPPSSETIVISFLCGSLVLSFLLAALGAVFKVYRPLVPIGQRLKKLWARAPEPQPPQTAEVAAVELVDNGFTGRESVVRGILAHPLPVAQIPIL